MKLSAVVGGLAAAVTMLALAAPSVALGAPNLEISVSHQATSGIPGGGHGLYAIRVHNGGSSETTGPVSVKFELPPASGFEITSVSDTIKAEFHLESWVCSIAGDKQSVTCTGPELTEYSFPLPIGANEDACQEFTEGELGENVPCDVLVTVKADQGLERGTMTPTITASGGADPTPANATDPTQTWLPFDVVDFEAATIDETANPYTQAGGHPFEAVNTMEFTRNIDFHDYPITGGSVKDGSVELPAGMIGNPSAYPQCSEAQLAANACPGDSQVGTVDITASDGSKTGVQAVYNLIPPFDQPAELGFSIEGVIWVHLEIKVHVDGTITVTIARIGQIVPIAGAQFRFWGVPADSSHDAERECHPKGCPSGVVPHTPFLSMPSSCSGPQTWTLHANAWQYPQVINADSVTPGTDGCNALSYTGPNAPSIQARPTTTAADAPSGLHVDVHTPQNEDPEGTAEAHLKDTVLALPKGMTLNPASANGLGSCSPAQVGIDAQTGTPNEAQPSCPNESKIGTVTVETPLLDHPVPGALYVATPYDNPFGSLLALYIVVDDPQSGTLLKLAGEVELDQQTGQLTTRVPNAPQLPFEDFKVDVSSGAFAPLRTPGTCGNYQTSSSLIPWSAPDSGPPATPTDSWAITQGPNGGACQSSEPNSPSLDAGTVSPIAGAYSPFVINLRREDGTQEFSSVSVSPPPGLTGKLAGIPYCPDSALAAAAAKSGAEEQASPSCPAASALGTVSAGAGAGPAPYYAKGTAYLTGPYKGAPLSMAVVTPAVAGPYDLGMIVVRVALHLNPATGQITADSDPIPSILKGIPLDVRSVQVRLDRDRFTRTGTSCDPFSVTGSLTSTLNQVAPLSVRSQLGECSSLGFKPKLGIRLVGQPKRGGHPALIGTLAMPEGGANLARAAVALPHSEFLDQGHIGTVCTRVQFAEGAGNGASCPAASVYGHAVATSPLVDYAVEGPAILRSSDHKLPDLVLALHGPPSQPVAIEAVGRIDSIKGGIRTTFENAPDLPLSKVVLSMQGGKKGLLENSTNLCQGKHKATAELDGHNGKGADLSPVLKDSKCRKAKKHRGHNKRHNRRRG